MSIFNNNIAPEPPKNKSWNNVAFQEFLGIFNKEYTEKWNPQNFWHATDEIYKFYNRIRETPYMSKSRFDKYISNHKRIPEHIMDIINKTIEKVYSDYGVWVKHKTQLGRNGRIKSLYFEKYC